MRSILKRILAAGASAVLAAGLAGCGEVPGVATEASGTPSAQASESAQKPSSGHGSHGSGASNAPDQSGSGNSGGSGGGLSEDQISQATAPDKTDMKNKDLEDAWPSGTPQIQLNGDSASCDAAGVSIDGSTVTITQGGSYVLSGSLSDGRVVVEAPDADDVQLVLNEASVSSSDGPAMRFNSADKVILTLADGAENSVADGQAYADESANAAIYAETDLSINGKGTLTVSGNSNNGISTKDDLKIADGTINVKAVNDALKGKDSVSILSGTFTLEAGGDGVQSDKDDDLEKGWIVIDGGDFKITAQEDAVQAETGLTINGGNFDVTTGGGYENGEEHTESWGFGRPEDFGGFRPGTDQSGTDGSFAGTRPDDANFDGARPQRPNRGDRNADGAAASSESSAQTADEAPSKERPSGDTAPQSARGGAENVMTTALAEEQTLEEAPEAQASETQAESAAPEADAAETPADAQSPAPSDGQTDSRARKSKDRAQDGSAQDSSGETARGSKNSQRDAQSSDATASQTTSDSRKGIKAGGVLTINDGSFNLNCADDAIHTNGSANITGGTFSLSSGDDGIHADGDLTISAGNISILESYEGLEACKIYVQGGDISIKSSDDGINAADGSGGFGPGADMSKFDVQISGGAINAVCGGDGIDSNGDVHVSGGDVRVLIDSTPDNCAIDAENTFTVTGGTLVYGGTGTGAGPGDDSTQSYVFAQGSFQAGTELSVRQNGQTLVSFAPSIDCSSVSFSAPGIVSGQSYEVYAGDALVTTATSGQGSSGMAGGMGQGGFPGGRPGFGQNGTQNGEPPALPSGVTPDGTPPAMPSDGKIPSADGSIQQGQRPGKRGDRGANASAQPSDGSQATESTLEEVAAV